MDSFAWYAKYVEEKGQAPVDASHLREFVLNRGGAMTYAQARASLASVLESGVDGGLTCGELGMHACCTLEEVTLPTQDISHAPQVPTNKVVNQGERSTGTSLVRFDKSVTNVGSLTVDVFEEAEDNQLGSRQLARWLVAEYLRIASLRTHVTHTSVEHSQPLTSLDTLRLESTSLPPKQAMHSIETLHEMLADAAEDTRMRRHSKASARQSFSTAATSFSNGALLSWEEVSDKDPNSSFQRHESVEDMEFECSEENPAEGDIDGVCYAEVNTNRQQQKRYDFGLGIKRCSTCSSICRNRGCGICQARVCSKCFPNHKWHCSL